MDRKAGNGCAIQSNVLATAVTHAHSTSGRRCVRAAEYIRRLTLFNSIKLHYPQHSCRIIVVNVFGGC